RDDRAIVGVGEAHFQRGRRELARKTWSELLVAVRPKPEAYARLAEVLGDHDLVEEASGYARMAQKLEPAKPHPPRPPARRLEKKKDVGGALAEWRTVLAKAQGPAFVSERREARSRLVSLLTRDGGRARLDEEQKKLRADLKRHPEDRE